MLKLTLILVLVALTSVLATRKEDGLLRFNIQQWSKSRSAIDQSDGKAIAPITRVGLYDFYIPIKVGSPPQELKVSFAALHSDIWFMSSDCKTNQCKGHGKYDHSLSSTYKPNGAHASGDNANYTGYLSSDDILLGDLVLKDFTFAEATDIDGLYAVYDGYLGLGPHKESRWSHTDHIMYKMIEEGIVAEPILSIYFKEFGLNQGDASSGEMIFGGVDESRFRGNISFVENIYYDDVKSWIFDIRSLSTYSSKEAKEVNICPQGCEMMIGHFNLLTYGPPKQVAALNEALGAKPLPGSLSGSSYFDDCGTANKSNITFTVGGQNLVMRPEHYLLETTYKNKTVCISAFGVSLANYPWMLGTKFMTAFYTAFDYANQLVGFAESR